VTDHGSTPGSGFGNISERAFTAVFETVERRRELVCCRVCGRSGLPVSPFEPE
jgi:hypothetical protein